MCSVKFASHCPSKHVSILLYFLIHEFDTHSSTVPKYITLGFPDKEIFQKLFLESVQFSLVALSCLTLCDSTNHSMPGLPSITDSRSSLKLMSINLVMPSSHLILCCPFLLLPPIPPSIRVFSNESTLGMRWPKYWSFSLSISPSNEHLGLVSFRMDWLDLLAVQGTLKNLLQHHSSKALFFIKIYFLFNLFEVLLL